MIADLVSVDDIQGRIVVLRGVPVVLDFELAAIYGYATKDLNRQVKNNIDKFDADFMFELTHEEWSVGGLRNPLTHYPQLILK